MPYRVVTYSQFLTRGTRHLRALMSAPGLSGGGRYKAPLGAAPALEFVALAEHEGAPLSQAGLRELTGLSSSSCQRCAAFLEGAGLVAFQPDNNDGRKIVLRLTRKGRATMRHIYEATIAPDDYAP
jgi:DNA-binding MarR family transcriptional regulator